MFRFTYVRARRRTNARMQHGLANAGIHTFCIIFISITKYAAKLNLILGKTYHYVDANRLLVTDGEGGDWKYSEFPMSPEGRINRVCGGGFRFRVGSLIQIKEAGGGISTQIRPSACLD